MKQNTNPFRGLILMLCILALIFCATSIFRTTSHQTEYSYADIRALFEEKKVDKVLVDDDTLNPDPQRAPERRPSGHVFPLQF